MTNPFDSDFTFEFLDKPRRARLTASRYLHAGGAYVGVEVWDDETGTYEPWVDFSCNVDSAFLLDPDYDIIVNHKVDGAILTAVIDAGLIESDPYTQVRSGFVRMPVHAMTDAGRAWFDATVARTESGADVV